MTIAAILSLVILAAIAAFIDWRVLKGRADARAAQRSQTSHIVSPTGGESHDAVSEPPVEEETDDDESPATIESLTKEGDEFYSKGENEEARDKYSEALELAREQFNDSDPRIATALLN